MKKSIYYLSLFSMLIIGCGKKAPAETTTPKTDETPTTKKDTPPKEEITKNNGKMTGTLTLDKTSFEPGEEISVSFTSDGITEKNAWVGLIPSNVAHGDESKNDQNDIAYKYLDGKKTGILKFTAPSTEGKFDFRLNSTDNNGVELASVSFEIKASSNSTADVSLNKKSYSKGEQIVITFTASSSWEGQAWIGLVPADIKHGSAAEADKYDLQYEYIKKRTKGTMKFNAPNESGKYTIRMFDAFAGKEAKSADFKVN